MREQQPLTQKARLLLLFNPLTEWIDRTSAFRIYMHNKTDHEGQNEVCAILPCLVSVLAEKRLPSRRRLPSSKFRRSWTSTASTWRNLSPLIFKPTL